MKIILTNHCNPEKHLGQLGHKDPVFYIVHFHADGGQCCEPGRRVFTDPDLAVIFYEERRDEPGHNCKGSCSIEISDVNPGEIGDIDLRYREE